MKIYDYHASEALFWFVHEDRGIFHDLQEKSAVNGLSIAQYVDKYKRKEFQKYAHDRFNIEIEYD
jgi:hypothetical protein